MIDTLSAESLADIKAAAIAQLAVMLTPATVLVLVAAAEQVSELRSQAIADTGQLQEVLARVASLEAALRDIAEMPMMNPLDVGFRHTPLTAKEIRERFEEAKAIAREALSDLGARHPSPGAAVMKHDWVKSTLGHGEAMCRRCCMTNREAAVFGLLDECEPADTLEDRILKQNGQEPQP